MRIAIYFTPPADHPLTVAAATWIGRDAFSDRPIAQPADGGFDAAEINALTASARRYGFHATLKPPFGIAPGGSIAEVSRALEAFARRLAPVLIPSLHVERLGSFFALTPAMPVPAINTLADAVVEHFDRYRAPATPDELARRRPERLSAAQRRNLDRWGYPYVFEEYRFHMTLTGEVAEPLRARVGRILEERFAALASRPLTIDALSIFVEAVPSSNFVVRQTVPLTLKTEPAGVR